MMLSGFFIDESLQHRREAMQCFLNDHTKLSVFILKFK